MADVSENHKYVKNRVYVRYPLETIQDSTCYICDSFSDHPQNDFKTATVIKRLEGNQDGQPHKNVTGAVLYSFKKIPYIHSVFHIFVILGDICHMIATWKVIQMFVL